jgi:hypothetical protein
MVSAAARAYNGGEISGGFFHMTPDPLEACVTMPEACFHWGKNRKTLEMAIARDRLRYRQAGRIYLIEVESLTRCWGAPKVPLCVHILGSCRT